MTISPVTEYLRVDRYATFTAFLKHLVCEVTFIKVNGELRIMICTKNISIIQAAEEKVNNITGASNVRSTYMSNQSRSVLKVFDLEQLRWKSFRINSVEKFKVV